ncbi:chaplin family protein [Amycolatopsis sp. NPDC102389]|uniref:chaplin family protein n=1 Tax=Amycolatopsis sp. NPDC102389 TaxID=3363941 RepID=UPI003801190C
MATGHWPTRRSAAVGAAQWRESLLGGNQVLTPITLPINLSGNAISILGTAKDLKDSTVVEADEPR